MRPIVSLDKQWIADHCAIREDEAEVSHVNFAVLDSFLAHLAIQIN